MYLHIMAGVGDGSSSDVEYREIEVGLSEEDPEGFVRVVALIPDFEVTRKPTLRGMKSEPAKGSKVDIDIQERSLLLKVTLKEKKSKKLVTHKLEYRILPHSIDKGKSKQKLEEGRIIILLKKKDDLSWTEYLMSEHGLETDLNS